MALCIYYNEDGVTEKVTLAKAIEMTRQDIQYSGRYMVEDDGYIVVKGLPEKPIETVCSVRKWADDKGRVEEFTLPEKDGYKIIKKGFIEIDDEFPIRAVNPENIPDDAVWVGDESRFVWEKYGTYYKLVIYYEEIKHEVPAIGDCQHCKHLYCTRRGNGIKCRNFREIKEIKE